MKRSKVKGKHSKPDEIITWALDNSQLKSRRKIENLIYFTDLT